MKLVYAAAGEFGTQPQGEDAGVLHAFVRVDGPGRLTVERVVLGHDGGVCGEPKEASKLWWIAPLPETVKSVDAASLQKGSTFGGQLKAGAQYLRITTPMDHMCGSEQLLDIVLKLRLDGKPVQLTRALDMRLPS